MEKTLSLTAPAEVFDATVEALCLKGNWAQNADTTLGDEGKVEFAKGVLLDFLGECIHSLEMAKVRDAINKQQQDAAAAISEGNAKARLSVKLKIN